MNEKEFDELWQRAEAEEYGRRLISQYPSWCQKQRRIKGLVIALVVAVAIVIPLHSAHLRQHRDFENVYCNRTGISDAQWASLAAEMITEV